ncbi:MAG: TnpV protein [Oscillospiraceae bacterium]
MNLEYLQNDDYFLPEIALSEQATKPLGKYGRL